MIVFITIRVSAAICPRASPSQPPTGTHGNPAVASCVWSTWWVTLGEQTRVICRECRRITERALQTVVLIVKNLRYFAVSNQKGSGRKDAEMEIKWIRQFLNA
jgi:hypothetical protein